MSMMEESRCFHSKGQRGEASAEVRKLAVKKGPSGRKGMEVVYLALVRIKVRKCHQDDQRLIYRFILLHALGPWHDNR